MTNQTKNPLKTEYCTMSDIFPWLKMEKLTQKEYEKRKKRREAMEKKHPRLKAKAFTHCVKHIPGQGWIVREPQLFIDVSEADKKQKEALAKWLYGQTCPLIPGVEMACYSWDYQKFYSAFIDGRTAEIND